MTSINRIDTTVSMLEEIEETGLVRVGTSDLLTIEDVEWGVQFLRKNPLVFLKEILGVKYISPKMQDIVNHIADNKFTYVRAAHGVSKSFCMAAIVIWYLETHEDSMVFTTAPTGRQVTEILWREIFKHRENAIVPLGGKFMRDRLKYSESWQGIGFASNTAVAYQGRHAKYLLWVLDEADGIDDEIWSAIKSSVTGTENKLIAIGNPLDQFSRFRKEQDLRPEDTFIVSAFESPNIVRINNQYITDEVAPGCATVESIAEWRDQFGSDSDEYRSRVKGEYPRSVMPNALLEIAEIEACYDLEKPEADWLIIGVDVAYEGGDKSILTFLSGHKFLGKASYERLDGQALKDEVSKWIDHYQSEGKLVTAIVYDAGGIATAFQEYLEESLFISDINLVPINFGEKPTKSRVEAKENLTHLMFNKRAEMYFDFRRAIKAQEISIPSTFLLEMEIPRMTYLTTRTGKFLVEAKDQIKKKIGHSPDISDSCVLAWHGRILGYTEIRGHIDLVM